MNSVFLKHNGIKGQKWGIRRFQYDNGTLTPEGKKRYGGETPRQIENGVDMKELKHHGILGMKWGIRRYQNEDGTLTPLGRKRLYNSELINEHKKRKEDIRYRRIMEDKELRQRVERLQMEKRYKELSDEDLKPMVTAGKKAFKQVVSEIGRRSLVTMGTGAALYGAKILMTDPDKFKKRDFIDAIVRGSVMK